MEKAEADNVAGCWGETRLGREERAAGKHDVGRSVAGHRDQISQHPWKLTQTLGATTAWEGWDRLDELLFGAVNSVWEVGVDS